MLKIIALVSLFFLAVTAAAEERTSDYDHVWWCTADGYDHNNQIRNISGDLKPSVKLAEQSALRICNGFYMGCRVRGCFQQR